MKCCKVPWLIAAFAVGIALNLGLYSMVMNHFVPQRDAHAQFAFNNGFGNNVFGDMLVPEIQVPPEKPCSPAQVQQVRGEVAPARDLELSGPFTHGNLSVFLIHGPDTLKDRQVMTLEEALRQNLAVVHDTGHFLTVNNRANVPLFIQSGDIVKGGNQDRTLPYDQLIPPQTDQQLQAFCVEEGRCGPRGNEISASFETSSEQLPGRQLKLAALHRKSQVDIWSGIRQTQANLTRNVGAPVQAAQSHTSLQLTLENPRVREAIDGYLQKLSPAADRNDTIGFAVAINGKIHTADVYGSAELFQKLYPKLLKASAVEALAERQGAGNFATPTAEAVKMFLAEAEKGQAFRQDVGGRVHILRQETAQTLLFDTCDGGQNNLVLHRSFLAR